LKVFAWFTGKDFYIFYSKKWVIPTFLRRKTLKTKGGEILWL